MTYQPFTLSFERQADGSSVKLRLSNRDGMLLAEDDAPLGLEEEGELKMLRRLIATSVGQQFRIGRRPVDFSYHGVGVLQVAGASLWRLFMCNRVGERLLDLLRAQDGLFDGDLVLTTETREDHDLLGLPWELLYDPKRRLYVVYDARVRVLRAFRCGTLPPPADLPLTAKCFMISPTDQVGFHTLWCQRELERYCCDVYGPYVKFDPTAYVATVDDFLKALNDYDVVYFLGHGQQQHSRPKCLHHGDSAVAGLRCSRCGYKLSLPGCDLTFRDIQHPPLCPNCRDGTQLELTAVCAIEDCHTPLQYQSESTGLYLTQNPQEAVWNPTSLLTADQLAAQFAVGGGPSVRLLILSGCHSLETAATVFAQDDCNPRPVVVAVQSLWPIACALSFHRALLAMLRDLVFHHMSPSHSTASWRTQVREHAPDLGAGRENPLWALPTVICASDPANGHDSDPDCSPDSVVRSSVYLRAERALVGLTDRQWNVLNRWAEMVELEIRDRTRLSANSFHIQTKELSIGPVRMDRYPVTVHHYNWLRRHLKETGHDVPLESPRNDSSDPPEAPVKVSFEAARLFCEWTSTLTGANWRLPTWQEWEYAARGGRPAIFPWCARICCRDNVADGSCSLATNPTHLCPLITRVAGRTWCIVEKPTHESVFAAEAGAGSDGSLAVDMIGNVPEFATDDQGQAVVAGWGHEFSLLLNVPGVWRRPSRIDCFGFRRVLQLD